MGLFKGRGGAGGARLETQPYRRSRPKKHINRFQYGTVRDVKFYKDRHRRIHLNKYIRRTAFLPSRSLQYLPRLTPAQPLGTRAASDSMILATRVQKKAAPPYPHAHYCRRPPVVYVGFTLTGGGAVLGAV